MACRSWIAWTTLVLVGGCGFNWKTELWLAGKPQLVETWNVPLATQLQAVHDQAVADSGCSDVEVTSGRDGAFVASACAASRRTVYVVALCHKGFTTVVRRYVPVSEPADPARYTSAIAKCTGAAIVDDAEWRTAINEHGAKDLGCPRDEVLPSSVGAGKFTEIAVAEGCGKRASYLPARPGEPLVLAAIVEIK
jgi:hypothetical protein